MKIKATKFVLVLGITIALVAAMSRFLPMLYTVYGETNNNCSDGWYITGYFNPHESDYGGSKRTISVVGALSGETTFIRSFLDSVLVEGAGLTHYGWWIANFDGEWQRIPFAEDALGGQLKVGSVATDPAIIPLGTSGITIPTLPSPWNMQVFKSVDTGGGPHGNDVTGKHIDVFTGDGKAAEQETFRITGGNHTVCISNASPTPPPVSSLPPPPQSPTPTSSPPLTPTPIPADRPPVADAGHSRPSQIVNQGSLVTLDGSASLDPNGDPLTYSWTQVSGPIVQLSNPNKAKVSFTAPSNLDNDAESSFKLTVTDRSGLSDNETVLILVKNTTTAPTAPPTGTTFDFGAAGDFGDGSTATDTAQLMVIIISICL